MEGITRTHVRMRHSLTLHAKIQLINDFDKGEKVCTISRKYSLPESTVRTILKNKKRILTAVKNEALLNSSTLTERHGIAQMETTLIKWCNKQLKENVKLTEPNVCAQARRIFGSLKLMDKTGKDEKFLASKGWYCRFKRRCGWNQTSDDPEALSGCDEVEDVDRNPNPSTNKLREIIEQGCYTPQTVFNVDKINLYWKRMPDTCYLGRLAKSSPGFKVSNDRFTIMIGGNAAGDFKCKPVLVYRNENPKALHGKSKGGLPVIWKSNPRACMTASIFEDWFGNYFIPEVERYCSSIGIPFNIMLIIDSAPGHPLGTLIDFDHRVKVVFLPPGGTNDIQPMYQEVVPIFKAQYTRRLLFHLNDLLRQHNTLSIEEVWERYSILDAIRIIVDSWAGINENDWKKAWDKIFQPSASNENNQMEDSTSEENRHTQIVEEIVGLAAELDMKISNMDVTELLDSHNEEPNVEEFAEMQKQNAIEELDTLDPLANEEKMTINKLTEALGHIKMGLQILEDLDPNEQRARNTMLEFSNILRPYEEILCAKIQSMATPNNMS